MKEYKKVGRPESPVKHHRVKLAIIRGNATKLETMVKQLRESAYELGKIMTLAKKHNSVSEDYTAKIKDLNSDADILAKIAGKFRNEADALASEIKALTAKQTIKGAIEDFGHLKMQYSTAEINLFDASDMQERVKKAINNLFDDEGAEHLFD